ncbi:MAG: hypothetical protein AAF488_03590 [Planctomycetota bacterium]
MNAPNAKKLLDGLRQQAEIYRALVGLTRNQAKVLEEGDTEAAVQLAAARENEMGRIEVIDAAIGDLKESWPEWRAEVEKELRETVQTEFRALGETIGEILALDREVESTYMAQRNRVSNEIQRLDGTRRVQRAYGTPNSGKSRMLDRSQ